LGDYYYLSSTIRNHIVFTTKNPSIQFEIVLIGEIVKDLAEKEDLKPFIEKAQKSRP